MFAIQIDIAMYTFKKPIFIYLPSSNSINYINSILKATYKK